MSDPIVGVDPAAAAFAVIGWRATRSRLDRAADDIVSASRSLQLDPATVDDPLRGVVDDLGIAADLLETRTEMMVAIEWAGTIDVGLLARHAGLLLALRGAAGEATDLADPTVLDEHRDHRTVSLGHLDLFGPDGPQASDVVQGQVGDCWLLAGLGAVAASDPQRLRDMVVDHGDGTYTVTFPSGTVTVDDEFPADEGHSTLYADDRAGVLWPLVLEKAWAMQHGADYDGIAGGQQHWTWADMGVTSTSIVALNPWGGRDPSDGDVAAFIDDHLDAGLPVAAGGDGAIGMGGRHAWSIEDVVTIAGVTNVVLRNPWGRSGFERDDDDDDWTWRYDDEVQPGADDVVIDEVAGTVTMPIDVFTDRFDDVSSIEAWDEP